MASSASAEHPRDKSITCAGEEGGHERVPNSITLMTRRTLQTGLHQAPPDLSLAFSSMLLTDRPLSSGLWGVNVY